MSITETDDQRPGQGAAPPAAVPGSGGGGGGPDRRRWWLGVIGGLLALALVVLGVLAGTYQPLIFGGAWGGAFPGLPGGTGLRPVNTFGSSNGGHLCAAAARRFHRAREHPEFWSCDGHH